MEDFLNPQKALKIKFSELFLNKKILPAWEDYN
jgi:hypothetical protein